MTLEEALNEIEVLKLKNSKLQHRVDFLEDLVYTETMEDYDNESDYDYDFDPFLDKYR